MSSYQVDVLCLVPLKITKATVWLQYALSSGYFSILSIEFTLRLDPKMMLK